MKIEIRKLKLHRELSEETNCYSAEIWIDGERAFLARNNGHGGADFYHRLGALTEQQVDDWLKAHRPKITMEGLELEYSLEIEICDLIEEHQQIAALRRKAKTHLLTIEDGQVFSRALKGRDPVAAAAALRRTTPDIILVQEAGDDGFRRAARIILGRPEGEEGVGR